ncbi:hypothetical protein QAD02_018575 [Eretmocerus hayati]|uniref:Uncharacterized protein n=1 Tax=Eretmocerus hayati TaxID=131215 RepID=A0ACC2PIB6_9HYME|nr:hypothetical protein QAD02_018575 [Eretmocerus hayati]
MKAVQGKCPILLLLSLLLISVRAHHVPGHRGEHQLHEPPPEVITFQRSAVERPPARILENLDYGAEGLPLRSAVESIPEHDVTQHLNLPLDHLPFTEAFGPLASLKLPSSPQNLVKQPKDEPRQQMLRDAVEYRPAPNKGIKSNNYVEPDAFWLEQLTAPAVRRMVAPPNVVCHLEAESVYREEPFVLLPRALPAHKCTHLVYSAATIDATDLVAIARDPEYDIVKGGYKAAVGQRRRDPALRVLLSISSPEHGRLFRDLLSAGEDVTLRFANSLTNLLLEYDFDGVEIDWDRATVSELKRLMRVVTSELREREFLVTLALRPEQVADFELASMVDLLILRAWHSRRVPGLANSPAPLKLVTEIVESLNRKSVPLEKIVMGLPMFGWSYKLAPGSGQGEKEAAHAIGLGTHGPYTKHKGELAYFEICEKQEEQWQYRRHEKNGSYLVLGDQWIGYDDPLSAKIKTAYVKSVGLAGVSLYTLDLDDFQGICGEPWPMLTSVTKTLGIFDGPEEECDKNGLYSDPDNCSGFISCYDGMLYRGQCGMGRFYDASRGRCVLARPELCDPGHSNKYTQVSKRQRMEKLELAEPQVTGPRVVCYITSWAMYRKAEAKFVPEHLDSRLCTEVVYAFAGLTPDTLMISSFDPWADIDNNLYERVTSISNSRVLLGLGGWTDSSGDKYSRLASSPSSRRRFASSAVQFLRKHGFQGLSLEWNYPGCWQSDCRRGPESDKSDFVELLAELRREFDNQSGPRMNLAVALSGYKEVIDKGYNVKAISDLVDFMTVMTYDYHGAWEGHTSHLAPLFAIPGDSSPYYNMNFTLNYLISKGADRSKIVADIPMYGQSYRLTSSEKSGLGDPAAGPGAAGEFTKQPGMLAYYEICDRIEKHGWQLGPGPSAHYKDQFVSFETPMSIAYKGQYVLNNKLGGAAAWTVDLDDFTNRCCQEPFPLLRSINRALGRLLTPAPTHKDCKKPDEPITPTPPTMTPHSDANDGHPLPTRPMKPTTWPTWTDKPSTPWNQGGGMTSTWWSTTPSTTLQQTWWPTTSSSQSTWWPTSPSTTSTTTSTTTERWPSVIQGGPTPSPGSLLAGSVCDGGEHKPDPDNCGTYYRCVLGELRREYCAPGLHWDATRMLCDWPTAAKCQKQTGNTSKKPIQATPKPTQRPTTTTSTTTVSFNEIDTGISSKECQHGQYSASPNSCGHFLLCVNGNMVERECGPGLNWNSGKKMCDWAFNSPCKNNDEGKKVNPSSNVRPPSKNQNKYPGGNPINKPNGQHKEIGTTPAHGQPCSEGSKTSVPGNCESYYGCLWGKYEIFDCAPGLHFSAQSGICDWPVRAHCDVSATAGSDSQQQSPSGVSSGGLNPVVPSTTALPPAEIDPAKPSPLSGHYKIVCYFTNWAWYRRGIGRYLPEHIDHTLCTHIIYGFAVLDTSNLIIKAHDDWADYDNHFYERVVAYKKRGVKVSLALGGWNDSEGSKYSKLVNNPESRKKFVAQALQFVEKYGFDGLDLDWEYPVCWQTDCTKGPSSDKQSFALLLKELSAVFKPKGLLLSSAVSPSKKIIDVGYDVPALAKYLDWIAVMTYDYHGQWDKKTGHVAPLYYHDDDDYYYFNANYTINYWISKGAPPRSIVMGMPLYGQAFTLNDPKASTGLNSPASAGTKGEFTNQAGFLAYYEICNRIQNKGWQVVQDPQRRMGPYAFKGNQWVSFDDADMIRQKAQYVRDMGLGGGMVWALDLDDFRGHCGKGPHPLMHTLQKVLAEPPTRHDRPIEPPRFGQEIEWEPPKAPQEALHDPVSEDSKKPSNIEDEYKVVCYFTNWAWYRQGEGKFLPEDIDANLCSHIIYGFAVLDGDSLTIKPHDSWADLDNKFYERVAAYKAKGIKVLIAIGGWNDSAGDKYSKLVNNKEARRRFIVHVIKFIEKYGFQGLDLDWEYPVCWQTDCNKGPKSDKEGFTKLVTELSAEFKPKDLLLSTAVSPNHRIVDEGYDVPVLAQHFDWISVMTYDFHGQWDKKTGHNAPFYVRPDDWEPTFNANYSIHHWIKRGAPPKKLVMGVPLYGQSFSLAERSVHGLNSPTYGGGEAGDATRARGFLSYFEICQRTLTKGWTVVQDPERRIGPYAYQGDQWVSFDDAEQVRRKSEYIKQMGLGGGMVWALDLDDFKNYCNCEPSPLLRTMNRVLRKYPDGPLCSVSKSVVTESEPSSVAPTVTSSTTTRRPSYDPPSKPSTAEPDVIDMDVFPVVEDAVEDIDAIEIEAGIRPPSNVVPMVSCEGKMFVPHEYDCHKYYLCNYGKLNELSCPNGLYWNENHCDWPENTKCKSKPESTNPSSGSSTLAPGQWEVKPSTSPATTSTTQWTWNPSSTTQWSWNPSSTTEWSWTTAATTPEDLGPQLPEKEIGGRKMVCYFTNWAWYRPNEGRFLPEDIDPSLCTHVIYGFAVLGWDGLIKSHDSWADIDNKFYQKVTALKKKGIRVLIGLGGWNDSLGDKYSRLVNNPEARRRFIEDVLRFIEKNRFDGLDLDWEYPVCWQTECKDDRKSDKEGFTAWVRELSAEFKKRGYLLSAAVSPSKRIIDAGYDVPVISKLFDWIAVMTYDYHGQWDKKTGHLAPLYYYPGDDYDYFNANFSMRYWIEKGAPSRKLVMGVPMYGQAFSLTQSTNNGLNAPAPSPGQAGEYTRAAGFLSFYEICSRVKKGGWKVNRDPQGRIGPYAVSDNQWVGYDDVSDVVRKANFIKELDLGGGMIWALDLDDFRNTCGCGKYPLLTALTNGLKNDIRNVQDCT